MDAQSLILEVMRGDRERLFTLYELERESGLDEATAQRVADELVLRGELVRVGDQYRPLVDNE